MINISNLASKKSLSYKEKIDYIIDDWAKDSLLKKRVANIIRGAFFETTEVSGKLFSYTWVIYEAFNELTDADLMDATYYPSELVSEIEDLVDDLNELESLS